MTQLRRSEEALLNQQFIDALREIIGVGPLYGTEPKSSRIQEQQDELFVAALDAPEIETEEEHAERERHRYSWHRMQRARGYGLCAGKPKPRYQPRSL